jgi:hypothetical protein
MGSARRQRQHQRGETLSVSVGELFADPRLDCVTQVGGVGHDNIIHQATDGSRHRPGPEGQPGSRASTTSQPAARPT